MDIFADFESKSMFWVSEIGFCELTWNFENFSKLFDILYFQVRFSFCTIFSQEVMTHVAEFVVGSTPYWIFVNSPCRYRIAWFRHCASGERAAGIERYRVSAPKSYCCALQRAIQGRRFFNPLAISGIWSKFSTTFL